MTTKKLGIKSHRHLILNLCVGWLEHFFAKPIIMHTFDRFHYAPKKQGTSVYPSYKTAKSKGFTLIEVMVALAIVSIGLLATLNAANQETRAALLTQDKMTAFWLMKNKMAEIRINEPWPDTRQKKDDVTLFDQIWYWQSTGKKTANPLIRTVTISFAKHASELKSDAVLEQTLYLGKVE